ncbi:C1 family peptidase, partial [Anaerovibrio slackiae]
MINVKRKSAMAFLAAALASINMSWAGAEPVIADNEAELLAAPYYNMDLANPADRHSGYNPALTLVNPVQNQGIFGTCWAFATVAAVESNVYKHMQA